MIYLADDIKKWQEKAHTKDNNWVLARPLQLGLMDRIKTAWAVLRGKCDGLYWHMQ